MKIIVTHTSPDWDAITSVWLIKHFLPGWNESTVEFVPAGQRKKGFSHTTEAIEQQGDTQVIHVDSGLGPLDHHQTSDETKCGASLTWQYIKESQLRSNRSQIGEKWASKTKAIDRMVDIVVDIDHFKELFWGDPSADYQEFSLPGVLEGLKIQKPNQDNTYIEFGAQCLDGVLHNLENRIWAEEELAKGIEFATEWGKGIGFSTINDAVIQLAQKKGFMVVVRKDPRKGYVRIKARPVSRERNKVTNKDPNLTSIYEKLKQLDPKATWYLHISKKILLNGSAKNPNMRPTTLSLEQIIQALEKV